MIVSELSKLLQECPAGLRVVVNGYEEGYDDLSLEQISIAKISLNTGNIPGRDGMEIRVTLQKGAPAGPRWLTPWLSSGCPTDARSFNWPALTLQMAAH